MPDFSPQSSQKTNETPLLSLAMIVRDGGQNLALLLADASRWVDEIVIADTGSADDSVAIAEAHGALVHHIEWTDDFAAARNQALSHCQGAWILVLDADELLCQSTWRDLRDWVEQRHRQQRFLAGNITTRNYLPDRYGKQGWTPVPNEDPHSLPQGPPSDGYFTTKKVRLFPNRPTIRFRGQLHETVEASLTESHVQVVDLPWPVHHFGYLAPSETKNKRYLHLAHLKISDQPHNAQAWGELAACAIAVNDHRQALVAIERSLVLDPEAPDHRLTAGWLTLGQNDLNKAESHLAAVTGYPEVGDHLLAEASHLRAQIAIKRERPLMAAPQLAVALRLFPDNGYYLNTLGSLHSLLGRGQAAHQAYTRASELLPHQASPQLNLGALCEAAEQPELALTHYAEALRREPDNEQAATRLQKTTLMPV